MCNLNLQSYTMNVTEEQTFSIMLKASNSKESKGHRFGDPVISFSIEYCHMREVHRQVLRRSRRLD